MADARSAIHNKLLLKLPWRDLETLYPTLERVTFKPRETLLRIGAPIPSVFFPETGNLAVLAGGSSHPGPIEVAMIGREGMTDMVLNPARDRSPFTIMVQVPGEGWRMPAEVYARNELELPSMHRLALRFQQYMTVQASYTALSHGVLSIPARLARWILMVHDRVGVDEFPLVQDFVSFMLAVRRAGVTDALNRIQSTGAIRGTRGRITILDRAILEALAGGSYGIIENEYRRLIEDESF